MVMNTENTSFGRTKRENVFFKNINRRDVFEMRDGVIPRIYSVREKAIHISVRFAFYSIKSIVSIVQGSQVTRKYSYKITRYIIHNLMNL